MKSYFQLLAFGAIQFLDFPKANEKMTKSFRNTAFVGMKLHQIGAIFLLGRPVLDLVPPVTQWHADANNWN
jgi:hypothetical protein